MLTQSHLGHTAVVHGMMRVSRDSTMDNKEAPLASTWLAYELWIANGWQWRHTGIIVYDVSIHVALMCVHIIQSISAGVLVWYEQSGVASYNGHLYFVNRGVYALRDITNNGLDVIELNGIYNSRWPTRRFGLAFQYRTTIGMNNTGEFFQAPVLVFIFQEHQPPGGRLNYVDEINPAHRRLQRWFRKLLLDKQPFRLAVAMAGHWRLGECSGLGGIGVDLVDMIIKAV
jgi:hypothetical protein